MALRSVLFVVFAMLALASSQTCSSPTDNQAFDASGLIVTLYNINSAASCCAACSGFQESKSYSWAKDGSQQCTCTNANSQTVYNPQSMGGTITSGYARSALTCSSNLLVGLDYNNGAIGPINTYQTAAQCCAACQNYIGCNYYGYAAWGSCYMRASNANPTSNTYLTSGAVVGPTPAPLRTGKRGIAWTASYSCTDLQAMTNVAWIYNWGPQPDAPLLQCMQALGIEYIPMLWGIGSNWPISYLSTTATHLLTYNEPNFGSQSALSPAQAAATWPQIQAFANKYNMKISSPSASTGGDMMDPIVWLDQFFAACPGCQVDFITTHIYTCYSVIPVLSQFAKYGLPIWVTEFSCPGVQDPTLVLPFMQEALAYMDGNPLFERYAWFGTRHNDGWLGPATSLYNNNGAGLSVIGQIYNTPVSSSSASSSASVAASASAITSATASVASSTSTAKSSTSSASTTAASSTIKVASASTSTSATASTSAVASTSATVSTSATALTSATASVASLASISVTVSVSASIGASVSVASSTSGSTSVAATKLSASSSSLTSATAASSTTGAAASTSASISASASTVSAASSSSVTSATVASSTTGAAASTSASVSASTVSVASTASTSTSASALASVSASASTSASASVSASAAANVAASTASSISAASTAAASAVSVSTSSTTGSVVTYPPAPGIPSQRSTIVPTTPVPSTTQAVTSPALTSAQPTTTASPTRAVTTPTPTTVQITTAAPTTKITTSAPTSKVTTSAPTTAKKTTSVPTTKMTTSAPTTMKKTTSVPSTKATTSKPTTVKATTVPPTSVKSTTVPATTATPTTVPSTTVQATTVKPTAPATTASPTTSKNCGSAPACGLQCYDPSMYTCSSNVLCPLGMQSCGGACYNPSQYKCVSGSLVQN